MRERGHQWLGGIRHSLANADVVRMTTTGGLEGGGSLSLSLSLSLRVVEPFFELGHMVPAVAEVIEIMDRLDAGLLNGIAESRFAGIDGLVAVIVVGSGILQRTSPAKNSKRWLFI